MLAAGAAAIGIAAAALIWWPRSQPFAIEPRADQNVLLITIDTLRADALSSYGGPAKTPHLDALAGQGARFTFAHAHVSEMRRVLAQGGPVGKRLDFLAQELHREANTLGSKSVDAELSQVSLELKVLIEQMREQVQNLE